ncbi:MAG: Dephospho-CoA kinase [Chlamydiae bacterium]|nr:Dephospho-CoA kinase [Chlamydiota bacterium]
MLVLKKVAITGGLSSGKTSVCEILKKKGAYVISADEIVHQLLDPQSKIGQEIVSLLGEDILTDTQFNRALIAKKVFNNTETLKSLEKILHPAVLEEVEKHYNQVKDQKKFTLFIAEIPLLYEIESHHLFDTVVTVITDPKTAKRRFQEKTNHSVQEFENRMAHQLPPAEKSAKADFTIQNDGDFAQLEKQVETFYHNITQE